MCGKYVDMVTEWPLVGLSDVRAIWCTFLAALRRRVSFSMPRSPADPCDDLVAHAESDHTPTRAGYKKHFVVFCRVSLSLAGAMTTVQIPLIREHPRFIIQVPL